MIRVTITGRLGKDPEIRSFGDNNVCNFSVASNSYQKGGEVTTWRNISVWGKQADSCMKFLKKGSFVIVTGEEADRKYDGGVSVDVRASHVEFGPRESSESRTYESPQGQGQGMGSSSGGAKTAFEDVPPISDDDILF